MPKEIPDRFKVHEDPDKMVFYELGEKPPEKMITLSDGTLVPESIFGRPPFDTPFNQYETWYADRELQLMSGGDENWPVDTTGDEE